jgi:hypothetical protein
MKKYLITFVLFFAALMAYSEIVPIETARIVARNFYFERANSIKPISLDAIKITQEFSVFNNQDPVYYIFNIGLDKGYVIVAAEDRVIPVLSYSFERFFLKENFPKAFNWIMDSYKEIINLTREKNLPANEQASSLWSYYTNFNAKSTSNISQIPPILGNITWDQGCYYNAMTPANGDASFCYRNPTGCVATAMAMIMKYYAWPTQGQGSYSYVHSTANGFSNNYGTLSANFGTSTYNWSSMPLNVVSANAEVAKIMYHCGVAVEMDYDQNGSGAVVGAAAGYPYPTAQKAFVNYFKYPTAVYFKKSAFTDENWKTKIKTNLDAGRPILYAGDDGSAGHAFVLDGYQGTNNDYYHFNFGWSGWGNGYFYLTNINPGGGGVGGGSYNFTLNQEGIFEIAKPSTNIEELSSNINFSVTPNPSNGNFSIEFELKPNELTTCTIYNIVGEKVYESALTENVSNINLSGVTKGIYYITIKSGKSVKTQKISILK